MSCLFWLPCWHPCLYWLLSLYYASARGTCWRTPASELPTLAPSGACRTVLGSSGPTCIGVPALRNQERRFLTVL